MRLLVFLERVQIAELGITSLHLTNILFVANVRGHVLLEITLASEFLVTALQHTDTNIC